MMKTLVTGANGMLGSNLVRELLRRDHEVKVLVRPGSDLRSLAGLEIEFFYGDLLDERRMQEAVDGCDYVIHAAGKVAGELTRFSDYAGPNLKGTQNIVRAAEIAGVSRMVHVSSCCVFSGGSMKHPGTELSEFTGFRFNSGYVYSKYLAQQWILSEVEKTRFPVVIVNPTMLIGPYDVRPTTGEVILRVLKQLVQPCPSGGKNYIDVRDAAIGTCNALTMGIPGECYLLGSENLTYAQFIDRVNQIYGRPGFRVMLPGMVLKGAGLIGNVIRMMTHRDTVVNLVNCRQISYDAYFSASKAVRTLGLPQRPVDEAIRDAIDWFIANGYLKPYLNQETFVPQAA
jgi:dihydroflavonol-4-reductase